MSEDTADEVALVRFAKRAAKVSAVATAAFAIVTFSCQVWICYGSWESTIIPNTAGNGDGCAEFDFKPAMVSGFVYGPDNGSSHPSAITRYSSGIPFGNFVFFDFDTLHYPSARDLGGRLVGVAKLRVNPFTRTVTLFYTGRSDGVNPIPPVEERAGRTFRWQSGRCDAPKAKTAQVAMPETYRGSSRN
jgi:hypothetical protein